MSKFFILSYKQITTGGGMPITNNKKFMIKLKTKAFGIDKDIKYRKSLVIMM